MKRKSTHRHFIMSSFIFGLHMEIVLMRSLTPTKTVMRICSKLSETLALSTSDMPLMQIDER